MSKYINVKLTEDQAAWVTNQLQFYEDEPMSHPDNAFIQRIVTKFEKALAEAKN